MVRLEFSALALAIGASVVLACHGGTPGSAALGSSAASAMPPPTDAMPEASAPISLSPVVAPAEPSGDAGVDAESGSPDMLPVPGGTFTMGADRGGEEDEHPAHSVRVAGFWLDRTEITNAAYASCVAAKACRPSDKHVAAVMHVGPDEGFHRPRQPVVGVGWDDARAYCTWVGKRLPREAEFERAERGDDGRRFPWGDEPPTRARTCFGQLLVTGSTTDDVGAHPTGKGPYGHDDLAGNVWEWLEDEYDPIAYTRAGAAEGKPGSCPEILAACAKLRQDGRQGFTGSNPIPTTCEHVLRGGAFNYDGPSLRTTNRVHHPGNYRLVMTGFRCAKD